MVLSPRSKIVALAGGVGGAKLAYGLAQQLSPQQFAIIGNVADDMELYGLHISPDLDTVMYTLAGLANPATGWGVNGDSSQMVEMLRAYGEDVWFGLGDRDLATHLLRTQWLAQRMTLTSVTWRLSSALGVRHRLLPATDDPLVTIVETQQLGALAFQEYFVRHRWKPAVERIWYQGAEDARITPDVSSALAEADVIVFCPSNPVLSIAPILAVPRIRELIEQRRGVCVAVSPFIGGQAVKGPAAKLMRELDLDISPQGLLHYYEGLVDGLVIDEADRGALNVGDSGVLVTRTLMQTDDEKRRLAGEVLEWAGSLT